jgi:hypothetical protein
MLNEIIPDADSLIAQLMEHQREYMVPTKNSLYSQRDLVYCLSLIGLDIPAQWIVTSVLAADYFL